MTDSSLKKQFAMMLLKEGDAFDAAMRVSGGVVGDALQMAREWIDDKEVLAFKKQLSESGVGQVDLPDHDTFAKECFRMAKAAGDADIQHKFMKLYADVRGYIQKPDTNINTNVDNSRHSKVMVVKDKGTDEEWEKKVAEQQQKLQADGEMMH